MAGFGKQDPKDVIKEAFGEDVEAVKARLAKLETLEASINEIKSTQATFGSGIDEVKTMIKDLKTPYEDTHTEKKTEEKIEKPDWYTDAEATFKDRITPLATAVLDTRAMMARREVMERINRLHPDLPWSLFEDEIDKIMEKESVTSKANPLLWENVYYVVKGKHHDEIGRDKNQKKGKFFIESGSSAIKVEEEKKKPEESLSEREKKIAAGLGISPEVYAKEKESMVF